MPSWRQSLVCSLLGAVLLIGLALVAYARTDIPSDLNSFATQQDNVYFWADGSEMAAIGSVDRQDMPLDKVPVKVQWAVLAAENETFYSDYGVSPKGMLRAGYEMIKGGDTQGGSTITQQYVKNAYLSQQQTLSRKFTEIMLSIKLDNHASKQQILEDYLNTSWFGRGTYGIERAAKAYYGKDASQLDVSEGAFLASLLKGAGLYDPAISAENHKRAVTRWRWVLDRLVAIGKLSPTERAAYTTFPEPMSTPASAGLSGQTGYLVDTARQYVSAHSDIPDQAFDLGGYQVYTTFRRPAVDALAAAVRKTTADLDPKHRPPDRNVRIGAASVASDGQIIALYGGPDYVKQGFNDSNAQTVPAGTAFTPIVYAAALTDGIQLQRGSPRTPVYPRTLYDGDDKVPLKTPEGPYWDSYGRIVKGTNDGNRSWGDISLRTAVEQSVNAPMMQLGMDVGLDRVRQTALSMGLLPQSMGEQVPLFSLGNSTPSAIRMADAYAAFAARGLHTEPYSVLRVTRAGNDVGPQKPPAVRVLTPQVAAEVTDALRGAVQEGPARAARPAGIGAAGKTGTSQDNKSAWFVGYTGQLSTAVSLFRIEPKSQELLPLNGLEGAPRNSTGSTYPIRIWTAYSTACAGDAADPEHPFGNSFPTASE